MARKLVWTLLILVCGCVSTDSSIARDIRSLQKGRGPDQGLAYVHLEKSGSAAVPELLKLAKDKSASFRSRGLAFVLLIKTKDGESLTFAKSVLVDKAENISVRSAIADAFGRLQDASLIPFLESAGMEGKIDLTRNCLHALERCRSMKGGEQAYQSVKSKAGIGS